MELDTFSKATKGPGDFQAVRNLILISSTTISRNQAYLEMVSGLEDVEREHPRATRRLPFPGTK